MLIFLRGLGNDHLVPGAVSRLLLAQSQNPSQQCSLTHAPRHCAHRQKGHNRESPLPLQPFVEVVMSEASVL